MSIYIIFRFFLFIPVFLFLYTNSYAFDLGQLESETAQELLLFFEEEEMLSVSFFPTDTGKAPGYSYVITNEQIKNSPARTLSDIIEMRIPGMITGGHEIHGPLIGTRGLLVDNNSKTLVMLDEQQINRRTNVGYNTGLLSPLLGDIDRIEFILGPGAILHGSGAINGFINMVPRNGEENPGVFINSEYGFAEEFWKFEAGYGVPYGKNRNIYLYGGIYGAAGFEPDELYGASKDFNIDAHGFEGENYRLSLYWNHDNFHLNTFFYENNPSKKSSVSEQGHYHQATLGIRPKYVFKINSTDSLEVIGSLLWLDHSSPGILGGTSDIVDRGGAERHWELKNIYKTTRWKHHSLAMGFLYGEKHFSRIEQFFSEDTDIALGSIDTNWTELSLFGEDVIAFSNSWIVSLGLRYDKVYLNDMYSVLWNEDKSPDEIKGHYSPRIATAYELDAATTIKASYQHGFRTPDVADYLWNLFHKDAAESIGLDFPSLGIETMDSFELNLQKNFPDNHSKLDINLFYNIFKDQLSWKFYDEIGLFTPDEIAAISTALQDDSGRPVPPVRGSVLNSEKTIKAYGGEIIGTFQPLDNTDLSMSYGYTQLNNADAMLYPNHQLKLNTLSYFMNRKLTLGLSYLYNIEYSESQLPAANSIYRKDRHVFDMALNYNITPDLSISASVKNLFESNVPPIVFEPDSPELGGLGHDTRMAYVSLRMKM